MLVHRCDRCGKDHSAPLDRVIMPVSFGFEGKTTVTHELCVNCLEDVRRVINDTKEKK